MSDAGNITPPANTTPPAPTGPTAEQLAALAPFQSQITWVASQEHARGRQEGARQLVEELGMPLDEIKAKLKALGTQQPPTQQGQGQDQQNQPNPDLERRLRELEETQTKLSERETKLSEREAKLKTGEQDGLKVEALEALGMSTAQARAAKAMMPLPDGVTDLTADLAKASAEQLKTMFPVLFTQPEGEQQDGGTGQQTTGTPADTRTRGTQTGSTASRGSQSASDRANDRLAARGHVKPVAS